MPQANHALWLKAKQDPVMVIDEAPYPSPGPTELVVKTKAVAINPADWGIQKFGVLLTKFPAILGCDAAGIVEEVGSDLTSTFKPGDRVVGAASPLEDYKYAAFQDYVVLRMPLLAKIPDDVKFSDAAVLPLGVNTAASCLFQPDMLGLELPPGNAGHGKTLLVWGASSSVGACGVQLAVAAGYEVFAIASGHNHDFLRSIGAGQCFDYNDANIVEAVVKALIGKDIVGAYDAISKEPTLHALCDILHRSGGRKFIASVMPGTEANAKLDVVIKINFASVLGESGTGPRIWQGFLEPALAAGKFQYKPDAEIVGHGLESVQKAVDLLSQGVSAKKLVVTL